jgi:hypothetical protein
VLLLAVPSDLVHAFLVVDVVLPLAAVDHIHGEPGHGSIVRQVILLLRHLGEEGVTLSLTTREEVRLR